MSNRKVLNPDKCLQAYVIGLALGDGNLSNPNGRAVRLRISCDTRYPFLIEKIKQSLQCLLPDNKVSLVLRPPNCVDVSCFSNYFESLLGWSASGGSKYTQSVRVPSWVRLDRAYSIACLRGLLETDGSIYYDRGYPMVMFVSIVENLAQAVFEIMELLCFQPRFYRYSGKGSKILYHVRLSKDVQVFLDIVKPQKY